MKTLMNLTDVKEGKIIRFILAQKKTHYKDISNYMQLSRKTITKYLDKIEEMIKPYNVNLIRKQNDGIYFEGDLRPLFNSLFNTSESEIPSNRTERILYIFSQLLMNSEYTTIQQLSEKLFVSRSTIVGDLKEVKEYLQKYDVALEHGQKGIRITTTEKKRRDLTSNLINMYWCKGSYIKREDEKIIQDIQLPTELFDKETLNKVILSLYEFCSQSKFNFTDYEFQSLAIHLVIAIERIKKNKFLTSADTGLKCEPITLLLVGILQDKFKMAIPEYEKNYINTHILAAQGKLIQKGEFKDTSNVINLNSVETFLRKNLKVISFDDELIKGLTLHLTSALKRLYLELTIHNPYTAETKHFFREAFERALDLRDKVFQTYGIGLNEDETAFLALHIQSFFERDKYNSVIKVVVVCSSGIGTSRLMVQRLKKHFSNEIQVTRALSLHELLETDVIEDLIISTIKIDITGVPVIVVSPFLNAQDVTMVKQAKESLKGTKVDPYYFNKLLDPRLIFINTEVKDKVEAIKFIGERLVALNLAKPGIIKSALDREEISSTAFNSMAIPHASIEYIIEPRIAVLISKTGINWGDEIVNCIFFIALNQRVNKEISFIYEYFNELIEDSNTLIKLKQSVSKEEVLQILKGELNASC